MIDQELLSILVCPENKTPVALAESALVDAVNDAIKSGAVKNKAGETVAEPIDGGLVREDGKVLYPIRDEIPVMLIEEAIPLPVEGAATGST